MIAWISLAATVFASLPAAAATGPGSIQARIVDAHDHRPVPGAKVLVAEIEHATIYCGAIETAFVSEPERAKDATGPRWSAQAVTDGEGRFSISDLLPGNYTLLAAHAKVGFAIGAITPSDPPLPVADFVLEPQRSFEATLIGPALDTTRQYIVLRPRSPPANLSIAPTLAPLAPGRYRAGPLPAIDDWLLVATDNVPAREFPATLFSTPVRLAPHGTTSVRVDRAGGLQVAGIVRGPDGKPLEDASVVVRSAGDPDREMGALSDARGRFAIAGLEPGRFILEAARWTPRAKTGCGQGTKDVEWKREIVLPLADPSAADVAVERFLDPVAPGTPAPAFTVTTLDGRKLSLADLRGKVVVIDFWASWCGMCLADLPKLSEAYAKLGGGRAFEIVGVSLDERPEDARRLVEKRRIPWPQTASGPSRKNAVAQLYNVWSTPTCVLVDQEGQVVCRDKTGDELLARLRRLLEARPGSR